MDDLKTELLKAFYGYATGNNKRKAELEGSEGAFRSRLPTIEDWLLLSLSRHDRYPRWPESTSRSAKSPEHQFLAVPRD